MKISKIEVKRKLLDLITRFPDRVESFEYDKYQRGAYFRLEKIVFHKWGNTSEGGPWYSVLIDPGNGGSYSFPILSDDDAKEVWGHMERNYHHPEDSEWYQSAKKIMETIIQ